MSVRAEGIRVQAWGSRPARVGFGHFDLQLTLYALLLVACGLLMAFSNSYYESPSPLQPGSLFTRGLLWLALAALVYLVATGFNYTWIRTFGWPLYAAGLVLLGVSLLAGTGSGGVARWVTVPVIGLQFQFSELAKILVIVALARFLALREEKLDSPLTIIGAGLLVLPPHPLCFRHLGRGVRLGGVAPDSRALHAAPLAHPAERLALAGSVRSAHLRGPGFDDPVPAAHQRRDGGWHHSH